MEGNTCSNIVSCCWSCWTGNFYYLTFLVAVTKLLTSFVEGRACWFSCLLSPVFSTQSGTQAYGMVPPYLGDVKSLEALFQIHPDRVMLNPVKLTRKTKWHTKWGVTIHFSEDRETVIQWSFPFSCCSHSWHTALLTETCRYWDNSGQS